MFQALQKLSLLGGIASQSASANVNGAYIDIRAMEGDIRLTSNVGTVAAGSAIAKLQDATDIGGTGVADATPLEGAFTSVTNANQNLREARHYPAKSLRGFVRAVFTVVTGAALIGADIEAMPKN